MKRRGKKLYEVTNDYDYTVIKIWADYIDYDGEFVILRLMGGQIVAMFYTPESVVEIDNEESENY